MSDLIRWDPFREMMTLRSAMDRLFENAFVGSDSGLMQPASWDLALDVAETGDEFLVKASLPGINPDDLYITYNDRVLTIKGEIKDEKNIEEQQYHLRERRYGSFSRSVALPATVKADKIEASYASGVLTLHLPKAEEAKPKRIAIRHDGSQKMIEGRVSDIKHKN